MTVGFALDDAVAQDLAEATRCDVNLVSGVRLVASSLRGQKRAALAELLASAGADAAAVDPSAGIRTIGGDRYVEGMFPLLNDRPASPLSQARAAQSPHPAAGLASDAAVPRRAAAAVRRRRRDGVRLWARRRAALQPAHEPPAPRDCRRGPGHRRRQLGAAGPGQRQRRSDRRGGGVQRRGRAAGVPAPVPADRLARQSPDRRLRSADPLAASRAGAALAGVVPEVAEETGLIARIDRWVLARRAPGAAVARVARRAGDQRQRQPLGAGVRPERSGPPGVGRAARDRPRAVRSAPRDHRERRDGRCRARARPCCRAEGARRAHQPRRLRHRLLVAELPAAASRSTR